MKDEDIKFVLKQQREDISRLTGIIETMQFQLSTFLMAQKMSPKRLASEYKQAKEINERYHEDFLKELEKI